VLFTQFVDDDLGCASYLVGCERCGEAVVVDPAYAIEQYLEEAERREVRIVRVLETHTHADHVSGHGRFALEHGVPVAIHSLAEPGYPFEPLADGDEIDVGNVRLGVIHTPGHRPEHCCFTVTDRTRGDEPWLLLTGDSLFVGEAARPDLAVEAHEGAEGLFHSLHRLLELSDGVEVYPGHVAGSLCGKGMSSKGSTTIGFERRFNAALALATVEQFVADSAGIAMPRPPNMGLIVELNRGPFLGAQAPVARVDAARGAVLDVRPFERFAAGHLPGSVNVPVSGHSFATKAGFVVSPPFAVHARSEDEAEHAVRGLRSVGFLEIEGVLVDPVAGASETLETVSLDELEDLLAADAVELVDVREQDERDEFPLPGSRHVPYRLAAQADVPADRTVVTVCESGVRAELAASVMAAHGLDARPLVGAGVQELAAAQVSRSTS
jgi:glyoxylase-like metal-dependent hydrolase (beta-lactamase superfamily II)/rhodanese-related sulfurtransferase